MSRSLPFTSKLGFGIGQVGEGVVLVVFSTFVLFFYNQVLGVPASLSAVALAVAMVFDAISDPLAGSISDGLKHRWGRRLPMMAGSALPLAIAIFALFNPPDGMSEFFYFGWLMCFAVLARLFLTLYHVPHLALGAEMASDYTERTKVFSYSQAFSTLASAGFPFLMYSLIFPTPEDGSHGLLNAAGYPKMSGIAAGAIVVTILLCVLGTKKEVPHLPKQPEAERFGVRRLLGELRLAFGSRSYRMLLSGMIIVLLVIGVEMTFIVYLHVHFWELPTEKMRWLGPTQLAALPLSVLAIPHLTKRVDKKVLLITMGGIFQINLNILIVLRLFTDWLPANGDPMLFVLLLCVSFVSGLIGPAMLVNFNSMFADVADELEYRAGVRQEGVIYAARSFCSKAAGGLALILGGLALDLIGFPRGAAVGEIDPQTIYNLGLIAGPPVMIIGLASTSFFFFYELTRERMREIAAANAKRQAALDTGGAANAKRQASLDTGG